MSQRIGQYLIHCYIYYECSSSVISDQDFDELAMSIYEDWESLSHPDKHRIDKEALMSGGNYIKYSERIRGAANHILRYGIPAPRRVARRRSSKKTVAPLRRTQRSPNPQP